MSIACPLANKDSMTWDQSLHPALRQQSGLDTYGYLGISIQLSKKFFRKHSNWLKLDDVSVDFAPSKSCYRNKSLISVAHFVLNGVNRCNSSSNSVESIWLSIPPLCFKEIDPERRCLGKQDNHEITCYFHFLLCSSCFQWWCFFFFRNARWAGRRPTNPSPHLNVQRDVVALPFLASLSKELRAPSEEWLMEVDGCL